MTYQALKNKQGVFPTEKWFGRIREHIDFEGKAVIDLGCAEGVMSRLAVSNGASYVTGVDHNKARLQTATQDGYDTSRLQFLYENIEALQFRKGYYDIDITIASMIIHWIGQEALRTVLNATGEQVAVIYREQNDHYKIPDNGIWFPTPGELLLFMASAGFKYKKLDLLLEQDNDKKILLAIFKRYRGVERVGNNKVHKWNGSTTITTQYIDGIDLFGDLPFDPKHKETELFLTGDQRKKLVGRFIQQLEDGVYYDISKRNVLFDGEDFYFIDKIPVLSMTDAIPIYQSFLDYLCIDYAFDGDLRKLKVVLEKAQ